MNLSSYIKNGKIKILFVKYLLQSSFSCLSSSFIFCKHICESFYKDILAINGIHLSATPTKDLRAWHLESTGFFTVKSLYRHLTTQKLNNPDLRVSDLCHQEVRKLWNVLWKIKVSSKMRIFIWRCAHNILPTSDTLQSRCLNVDGMCASCPTIRETCIHTLRDCPHSSHIWDEMEACFNRDFLVRDSISFLRWLYSNITNDSEEHRRIFVVTAWSLWNERNNIVHGKNPRNVHIHLQNIKHSIHEQSTILDGVHGQDSASMQGPARGDIPVRQNMGAHWFIVNVDVAMNLDGLSMGLGVTIRKGNGSWYGGGIRRLSGSTNVLIGEALAVKFGLELAAQFGVRFLVIKSDSLSVVNSINAVSSDLSSIGSIIRDIRQFSSQFLGLSITHISRVFNCAAHACARYSLCCSSTFIWKDFIPPFIVPLLLQQESRPDE